MSRPLVTVVIPSLNQGQFLEQAITSTLDQDVETELYIMDGGSTDDSIQIIRKWDRHISAWRSSPDGGQAQAINEGIQLGSAPFVCWLNSDDFFYREGLGSLVAALEGDPDTAFAYGRCWTVTSTGRRISPYLTAGFSPTLFSSFCTICQPGTLIRRSAWNAVHGLDKSLYLAFDYDLWWKLFKRFGKPQYLKKFVAATRAHKATKTATNIEQHYSESISVVTRYQRIIPLKWKLLLPIMRLIRRIF